MTLSSRLEINIVVASAIKVYLHFFDVFIYFRKKNQVTTHKSLFFSNFHLKYVRTVGDEIKRPPYNILILFHVETIHFKQNVFICKFPNIQISKNTNCIFSKPKINKKKPFSSKTLYAHFLFFHFRSNYIFI